MTEAKKDSGAAAGEEAAALDVEAVEVPTDGELPEPTAIAVVDEADVYRRMDLEDDRQIMEELQGRALDVMLYSFEQGGSRVTGFSWKGAREAVRTLNARGFTRIRMRPDVEPKVEEFVDEDGDEAYRVTIYAEDVAHGGGNWGIATAKKKPIAKGKPKADKFAITKALSKAQRNAFEALIPLEAVEYLKAQYLGAGQVKVIPGASRAEIEAPKPLDDEQAKQQISELRELYAEIRALDPLVMPPGQFNSILTGAQHSHDRLEDAREHLATFLDGEKDLAARREEFRALVPSEVYDREVAKMAGMTQQRRLGQLATLVDQAEKARGS